MSKRIVSSLLILLVSFQMAIPAYAQDAVVSMHLADVFCQKGQQYFVGGKYPEALREFSKAILVNDESGLARSYIQRIKEEMGHASRKPPAGLPAQKPAMVRAYMNGFGDLRGREAVKVLRLAPSSQTSPMDASFLKKRYSEDVMSLLDDVILSKEGGVIKPIKILEGQHLSSVTSVNSIRKPHEEVYQIHRMPQASGAGDIHVPSDEYLIFEGEGIKRVLVTCPDICLVESRTSERVKIKTQDMGSGFIHIWDSDGRHSIKVVVGPGRLVEEEARLNAKKDSDGQLPESFKLSYSIEGDQFYTGRGFEDQSRTSDSNAYTFGLQGQTPYGMLDSSTQGSRTQSGNYRVSHIRAGLTDGHIGPLKNLTVRGLDFTPHFRSFGFPTSDLRGVKVDVPFAKRTLRTMAFWGAIPRGDFTSLSSDSGLSETKNAWLEGAALDYKFGSLGNLKAFFAHSYGEERTQPVLTDDIGGLEMNTTLGNLRLNAGMVSDMKNISYTAEAGLRFRKFNASLKMQDDNKHFRSLFGGEPTSGSTSGNLSLHYQPTDELGLYQSFSGFRDKVFGNPNDPTRPNYFATTRLNWRPDRHTDVEVSYTMDDQKGTNSPAVIETKEVGIRKTLFAWRTFQTFLNYQNQKSKFYTNPTQDYNNNQIVVGASLRLIGSLRAYYNREMNFIYNKYLDQDTSPTVQEYGLHYSGRIPKTPLFTSLRLSYRDEQGTESQLSSLSGEDRLEGEGELTFKPTPDSELFVKVRVTNVWAEKEGIEKHLDMAFNWGLRFLWDTGLRWQSVGGFAGYVFYDENGDGIKQADEGGVEGVVILGPEDNQATTSLAGYYKMSGIKGSNARLEMDLNTLPQGYSSTTSFEKEVNIENLITRRVDFGIASRCEVRGIVFIDKNENTVFDAGEEVLSNVVLILDDSLRTASDGSGEYRFRKLSPGEHTLKLDLSSIPTEYVPKVPLKKTIEVKEGVGFVYNVPLWLTKKASPPDGDEA